MNIFISHSWAYSQHYDRLAEWIFGSSWSVNQQRIYFFDTSVPKHDPIHYAPNDQMLQQAIFERIFRSDVVVIPTGIYANYSKWIGKEIDGSRIYRKAILAVDLWAKQRTSSVVRNAADEVVGWNKQSVVDALWRLCRRGY